MTLLRSLCAVLLACLATLGATAQIKIEPKDPAAYAEADLGRLVGLLGLREDQLGKCRATLAANESKVAQEREALRLATAELNAKFEKYYAELARMLEPEQAEKLMQMLEAGELPMTWEMATPGSVSVKALQKDPKSKDAGAGQRSSIAR
jgi:hypothetical protein